jgi:hypothetical protein
VVTSSPSGEPNDLQVVDEVDRFAKLLVLKGEDTLLSATPILDRLWISAGRRSPLWNSVGEEWPSSISECLALVERDEASFSSLS